MPDTKIYDLDGAPAAVKKWTELENILVYHDFFQSHGDDFYTE
jgi:hypothetical protein